MKQSGVTGLASSTDCKVKAKEQKSRSSPKVECFVNSTPFDANQRNETQNTSQIETQVLRSAMRRVIETQFFFWSKILVQIRSETNDDNRKSMPKMALIIVRYRIYRIVIVSGEEERSEVCFLKSLPWPLDCMQ